jgi:hypothetical protein
MEWLNLEGIGDKKEIVQVMSAFGIPRLIF